MHYGLRTASSACHINFKQSYTLFAVFVQGINIENKILRAAAASLEQELLSRARTAVPQTMYLIDIHMFYILLIMYYRVFVSACQVSALFPLRERHTKL